MEVTFPANESYEAAVTLTSKEVSLSNRSLAVCRYCTRQASLTEHPRGLVCQSDSDIAATWWPNWHNGITPFATPPADWHLH